MNVPFGAGLFQRFIGENGTLVACAADSQLHCQYRNAHNEQAQNVEENKIAAAVFARYVGKAPDIADADGAAGADEQEAKTGTEGFAFHVDLPRL